MKLIAWLKEKKISQRKFAIELGITVQALNFMIHAKRPWPPELALIIEVRTDGEVDRYDLMGSRALALWPRGRRSSTNGPGKEGA